MVKGLDVFKEFFKEFNANYLLIGGTACEHHLSSAGLDFRATRDLDIILIVEAYSAVFISKFWEFIKAGGYNEQEKSNSSKKYYRFSKPTIESFPYQIELFARNPDISLGDDQHLAPLPTDEDISSLSAILLNDEYYHFTLFNSVNEDGLRLASVSSLICLKANAYLDLKKRKESGAQIDNNKILKHKKDVIRLTQLLPGTELSVVPELIRADLRNLIDDYIKYPVDITSLGVFNISMEEIIVQLKTTFRL